ELVLNTRTFEEHFVNFDLEVIYDNNAFAKLCETVVADFVKAILDEEVDTIDYILDLFDGARVGDVVTIVNADFAESEGKWAIGEEEPFTAVINNVLNVNVEMVRGWLELDPFDVFEVLEDVFGDVRVGDFAMIAMPDLYEDKGAWLNDEDAMPNMVADVFNVTLSDVKAWLDQDPIDVIDIVNDIFTDRAIIDVVDIIANVGMTVNNGNKVWSIEEQPTALIVSDILSVKFEEIFDLFAEDADLIADAVSVVFDNRTFGDYFADFGLEVITENNAFAKLCATKVVDFVNAILDEEVETIDYILGLFDDARIIDVVAIFADTFKGAKSNGVEVWAINENGLPLIVSDILDLTAGEIRHAFDEDVDVVEAIVRALFDDRNFYIYFYDFAVEAIYANDSFTALCDKSVADFIVELINNDDPVNYVLSFLDDVKLGDAIGIFVEAYKGEKENGNLVWAIAEYGMALIASDVLDVTVGEIRNVLDEETEDKVMAIANAIFDGRTFGEYIADLDLTVITDNKAFTGLCEKVVVDFVSEITAEDADVVSVVLDLFNGARVGDFVTIANADFAESEGKWAIGEEDPFTAVINNVLNVNVEMVRGWLELDPFDVFDVLEDVFGNVRVGDFAMIAMPDLYEDRGAWISDAETMPNMVADVFNITLSDIRAWLDQDPIDAVQIVEDVFGERAIVDLVDVIFNVGLTVKENGHKVWVVEENEMPLIVSDVLDVKIVEILDLLAEDADIVADSVEMVFGDRSLLTYVDDIVEIENEGLAKLLDLKITESVNVVLGNTEGMVIDENITGDTTIDYFLNHTDSVKIGEFLLDTFSYDASTGKWSDEAGEVGDIVQFVLDAPVSYVIYAIAVIVDPSLILDMIGDDRIGTYVIDMYNDLDFGSTISGDNEAGYVVVGAFKAVVEEVINLRVREIYGYIFETNNLVEEFETILLDREIGDYAFDLINVIFDHELMICAQGTYAHDYKTTGSYVLNKNFKAILEPVFNLNIKDFIEDDDQIECLKNLYQEVTVGDITFDLLRKFVEETVPMGLETYAFENKEANGNAYATSRNFKAIVDAILNVKVFDVVDAIENDDINNYLYNTFSHLTIGDFAYDVTRKYLAEYFVLNVEGYAWNYSEDNTLMTGKVAKLFRAIFNVTLANVYDLVKEEISVENFIVKHFGALTVGDVVAPWIEGLAESMVDVKFDFDKENDYALAVSGDFAEIANAVFGVTVETIVNTEYKGNIVFGENGILENMPVGHVVGYVLKMDGVKEFFEYMNVSHEYNGEWVITGAYVVPMSILCNELTFGALYANKDNVMDGIVKAYFGEVMVGQFMGGSKIGDVWYTPSGDACETHGAEVVIMNVIYNISVNELLDEDFDPTSLIADIQAGQLMGYYYCGEFKYTKAEDGDYRICEDETHVDGEDGYHTHFDCEIEDEGHDHATMGAGWYTLNEGVYEKVGAIEGAVANVTIRTLIGGGFDMAKVLAGIKLGEAMNLAYCDGTANCAIKAEDATHECRVGWYKEVVSGGITVYEKEGVLVDKIAEIKLDDLFTDGLSLEDTFRGTTVGDVLDYARCYEVVEKDELGNVISTTRVCDHRLGHTDEQHVKDMWYVETEDGYRKATPLERVMASVGMGDIVRGDFNAEETLEHLRLGEFMGYERCSGEGDCFVGHDVHEEGSWYKEKTDEHGNKTYEKETSNLALAIADYRLDEMQGEHFMTTLLNNITATVTVEDIFGKEAFEEGSTNPISILAPTTRINEISTKMKEAMGTVTVGKLYSVEMLPIGNSETSLNNVFKKLYANEKDANASNDYLKAALVVSGNTARYDELMANAGADGSEMWKAMTASELVNVIVTVLDTVFQIPGV
ncbi:MAG: hypothetical protein IJY84_01750, partial [Clostridia bacterium]|nr:hypothetical protein [Clostridia bacterium]